MFNLSMFNNWKRIHYQTTCFALGKWPDVHSIDIIPSSTHYFVSCNLQPTSWRKICTSSILYLPIMISDNFYSNYIRIPKDGGHLRMTFFLPLCQVYGLIGLLTVPPIWRLIIASMVAQMDNWWSLQQLNTPKWPWRHISIAMSSAIHLLK